MASTNPQERLLDMTFEHFAMSLLPLYSGPQVSIRIGSGSHEYKLPKALLCKQSEYFAAMFEGPFKEGKEQSTTLEEIDDVVTPRSFRMLVQWVCLGRVMFEECAPDVSVTMAIEFARLADMCRVTGMESFMAEHIKATILANPGPGDWKWCGSRSPDIHTHCLTSKHITSAVALPEGHPVRTILAAATVEGFIRGHNYKFEKEASSVPGFSADLLKAVRATLQDISIKYDAPAFADPISGVTVILRREEE